MGITARYVGEEPTSLVTGLYNQVMAKRLQEAGIGCVIVPRKPSTRYLSGPVYMSGYQRQMGTK